MSTLYDHTHDHGVISYPYWGKKKRQNNYLFPPLPIQPRPSVSQVHVCTVCSLRHTDHGCEMGVNFSTELFSHDKMAAVYRSWLDQDKPRPCFSWENVFGLAQKP